jgi:hypothetical protein
MSLETKSTATDAVFSWTYIADAVNDGIRPSLSRFLFRHPHTLEHLVFLGSKRYPERGFLDTLACRCLSEGTNAYTANEVSRPNLLVLDAN